MQISKGAYVDVHGRHMAAIPHGLLMELRLDKHKMEEAAVRVTLVLFLFV